MRTLSKWIVVIALAGLFAWGAAASADHHERHEESEHHSGHDGKHHEKHERDRHGGESLQPVVNSTYQETCGACHFAYQPALLPSRSWEKILASPDDHFGESLGLDNAARTSILEYLKSNSANRSSSKRAVKIVRSLGGQTPLRITEIPYIRHKHHEIGPDVFNRRSIGSFSNCSACHQTADQGIYDDDNVAIPK